MIIKKIGQAKLHPLSININDLNYYYKNTQPDGNCLFESLFKSYKHNIKQHNHFLPKHYKNLRYILVNEILTYWNFFKDFLSAEYKNKHNYSLEMNNPSTFGDHPEIIAFCNRYNCYVCILSTLNNKLVIKNILEKPYNNYTPKNRIIYIYHHTNLDNSGIQHYGYVIPKKTSNSKTKKKRRVRKL